MASTQSKTTITDIPRCGNDENDDFRIGCYEEGLTNFLRNSATPITIALQGEWGSGKTSLMNVLYHKLCGGEGNKGDFFPVWINTWEYSLMSNSRETLVQILNKMIKEISKFSKFSPKDLLKTGKTILTGFVKVGTKFVGNKASDGFGDSVADAITFEENLSFGDLREELQEHIVRCMSENPRKKGIIFFIDDLDRLDPEVAVELLELLKNVFTLENCIFVLAIDYDVVIKGLKSKFGELNETNEREFRSFFDKIIQVPFAMPVSQYYMDDFLKTKLNEMTIISKTFMKDEILIKKIIDAVNLTVGSNPRSLKRFLNTLSLIQCISEAQKKQKTDSNVVSNEKKKLDLFLNIAIVGVQVAYPKVYQLLLQNPGFSMWDDIDAASMGVPRLDEETENRIKKKTEFDEKWEQVLYRLCLTDKYLERNAFYISQLFDSIRTEIKTYNDNLKTDDDSAVFDVDNAIKEHIKEQLDQSSITGFAPNDSLPVSFNKADTLYTILSFLKMELNDKLNNYQFIIKNKKTNGAISIKERDESVSIKLVTVDGKIQFQSSIVTNMIRFVPDIHRMYIPEGISAARKRVNISDYNDICRTGFEEFARLCEEYKDSPVYQLKMERLCDNIQEKFAIKFCFDVTVDNPKKFNEKAMDIMQEVVVQMFNACINMNNGHN